MCSTLVPHNDYVTKPRALNVFIDGLAEFVVEREKKNDSLCHSTTSFSENVVLVDTSYKVL